MVRSFLEDAFELTALAAFLTLIALIARGAGY